MAGAARNAADMASTKLNMNATNTSTWETPSPMRTSFMPASPGVVDELRHHPADEQDAHDRQAQQHPQQPAPSDLAQR